MFSFKTTYSHFYSEGGGCHARWWPRTLSDNKTLIHSRTWIEIVLTKPAVWLFGWQCCPLRWSSTLLPHWNIQLLDYLFGFELCTDLLGPTWWSQLNSPEFSFGATCRLTCFGFKSRLLFLPIRWKLQLNLFIFDDKVLRYCTSKARGSSSRWIKDCL